MEDNKTDTEITVEISEYLTPYYHRTSDIIHDEIQRKYWTSNS